MIIFVSKIIDMKNEKGQFVIGHKETKEEKHKRGLAIKGQWPQRENYHGMYGTKIYNSWRSMITRCNGTCGKDSIKKYKDKGTTVCDEWKYFRAFYKDMGPTHKEGLTIDRVDNSKGYFKDNCRWSTPKEQANNKTNVKKFEYLGQTKTLSEWAEYLGITKATLRIRYHRKYKKGLITIEQMFLNGKENSDIK